MTHGVVAGTRTVWHSHEHIRSWAALVTSSGAPLAQAASEATSTMQEDNVLKRYLIGVTAAAMLSTAAAGAQTYGDDETQQTQPGTETEQSQPGSDDTQQTEPATTTEEESSSQTTGTAGTQAAGASTTLTGCVYKEADVPGRTPNIAERAGIMEDYVLAISDEGAEPGSTATSGATEGTAGTTGASAGKMYKLEHAADQDLSEVVGKRVEVTGRIDADEGDTMGAGTTGAPAGDDSVGPDRIELPEFEVTSIREVGGDCPDRPDAAR